MKGRDNLATSTKRASKGSVLKQETSPELVESLLSQREKSCFDFPSTLTLNTSFLSLLKNVIITVYQGGNAIYIHQQL